MSSVIPEIKLSEFKLMRADEIRQMKSCELTCDGEYLCTVIIPPKEGGISVEDYVRVHAEQAGFSGNTIGGKEYSQIKGG